MANLIDDLSQNQSSYKEKKKGSKAGIIFILFLILVLIAGAGVWYFLKYYRKKTTPKDDFIKYLGSVDYASILNLEKIKNLTDRLENESSESNIDMSGNIATSMSENDENALSDMKINVISKKDPLEEKMSSKIELTYKDNEIFSFNVLSNGEDIGVLSDAVVVKYVGSSFENLKDIIMKTSDRDIPMGFDANMIKNLKMKLPYFTNDMFANYIEIIRKNSPDTAFSAKPITLDRNSQKIDVTEYSMKLNETQAISIIKLLLQQLENDEELFNNLLTPLGDNQEFIKDFIKTRIQGINTSLYERTPDDSKIYTVKVYGVNDKTYKISLDLFEKYSIDFDYDYSDKTNSMTMTLLEKENQGGYSVEIKKNISDVSENLNFTINMIAESEIVGELKIVTDLVNSGNTSTLKNQFSLNAMILNINAQINQKISFKKVEIEELTNENTVFLDELDQSTFTDVVTAVKQRTVEVINENLINQQLRPIELKEKEVQEPQEPSEPIEVQEPQGRIEINPEPPSPEETEELKEAAKTKLIQSISEAMTNAQAEGKTYVLEDLLKLKIPGTILSIDIVDEEASIEIDGFEFKINAQFELYE